MRIDLISLFPEFVAQCAGFGVVGRAQERGLLALHGWNPRDYAEGNYRRVDDRPFGGGPGMVMLIDPLRACLQAARAADPAPARVVYLSPQGQRLTQAKVRELAGHERLVLLCGRYEGVDERLLETEVDEELSIGDYVLSGGELAAAVVVDAVARLQEGALNDAGSAAQDSFALHPAGRARAGQRPAGPAVGQPRGDRPLAPDGVPGPDLAPEARPAGRGRLVGRRPGPADGLPQPLRPGDRRTGRRRLSP
jgi:tRNA (guanine-N1)-methyltransferase